MQALLIINGSWSGPLSNLTKDRQLERPEATTARLGFVAGTHLLFYYLFRVHGGLRV